MLTVKKTRGNLLKVVLAGGIVLLIAGCSQMITPNASDTTTQVVPTQTLLSAFTVVPILTALPENPQETPIMNEVPIPTPLDPSLEKIVTQAKNDLVQRLAIDPEQVELFEVTSVTWPDGSLGCPRPGMEYTQVQVDGLVIRFRVTDSVYEYHSGGGRAPFLCK